MSNLQAADGFDPRPLLIASVQYSRITRYFHVAAYSVAVYDWLLCMKQEAKLVATPGFSPAKITYLICRYWPLVAHIVTMWVQIQDHPEDVCARTFKAALFVVIPSYAAAASVLTTRVYAFSGCNVSIAAFLVCSFLTVSAYQTWALVTQVDLLPRAVGYGCYPVERLGSSAKYLSGFFFAPLVFDFVATAIFAACAISVIRFRFSQASTFTRVFVREGAAYFVAISAVNFANAAMSFQPKVEISGTIVPLSMLFPNILACRLVLNLRSAVSEGQNAPSPSAAASTRVQFRRPQRSKGSADEEAITLADLRPDATPADADLPGSRSSTGTAIAEPTKAGGRRAESTTWV